MFCLFRCQTLVHIHVLSLSVRLRGIFVFYLFMCQTQVHIHVLSAVCKDDALR